MPEKRVARRRMPARSPRAARAVAQAYPAKTVKIVAPVQPGGGVDLIARTVAEQLTKAHGPDVHRRERLRRAAA